MYFKIRGLNIFHWWNNPSADYIDKTIIEEIIRGLVLITTKDTTRPRVYYYFNKERLLQVYEKYGNIKNKTLKKVCGKYSLWKGWFKEYKGTLKQEYLSLKLERMSNVVDEFADKFGSLEEEEIPQFIRPRDALKYFPQYKNRDYVSQKLRAYAEDGTFKKNVDYIEVKDHKLYHVESLKKISPLRDVIE